jgi:hypothetical protein
MNKEAPKIARVADEHLAARAESDAEIGRRYTWPNGDMISIPADLDCAFEMQVVLRGI